MPPVLRSGRQEGFPYSLSRWTDLPAAKWSWFKERLQQGQMLGVDPTTGVPALWSLRPEDTLGMVFWTRDGRNLLRDASLLEPYRKVVHFTLTGWHEVEHKAPDIELGLSILRSLVHTFGADNVYWRFSPVPLVDDVEHRFQRIAEEVRRMGLNQVYLAFLQPNDILTETRALQDRTALLERMARSVPDMQLLLCNEDTSLQKRVLSNLSRGICEDGTRFSSQVQTEGCGCALAVDPFTLNETCRFGCEYCYSADKSLAPKKRNTTRGLPVLT